jgi:hypothetical protein
MKEVVSGVFHWTRKHPKIGIDVSSYYLEPEGVLLDPLVPEEGLDGFPGKPHHVLLTNRHHFRESDGFRDRFDCKVWCVEQGMHEFGHDDRVHPFRWGDDLPGGIVALEIGALCPDETAFHLSRDGGILVVADGVVRRDDGPLGFVPDEYMGDDAQGVKRGLKASYRRVTEERTFDALLLAHGWPWIGGARDALAEFASSEAQG